MRPIFLFLFLLTHLFAYQVSFEGNLSEEIFLMINAVSHLENEKSRPPPTLFTLKKRAESDKKTLLQALHSFGYYEAEITLSYWGEFPHTIVRVCFQPGPLYTVSSLVIVDEVDNPIPLPGSLEIGTPALSASILNLEDQILEKIIAQGYPFASIQDRKVIVDQETKCVSVSYEVEKGPLAYFGETEVIGHSKVQSRYIKRRIQWSPGELYDPNLVLNTDAYLQESGLFSVVTVTPADTLDACGTLPMLIRVEEKRYRHIGAGLSYSTDESGGIMAQWSHDNLTGWGDTLAFNGEYSARIKRATLLYGIADLFGKGRDLLYSAEIRREDAPGFIERELSCLIRFTRRVSPCFSYNYGARFERLLSTKSDNNEHYNLLSSPIQVRFDTSNRLLNPTRGTTLAFFFTPHQSLFYPRIAFLKQELLASTYQPLTPSGSLLLALFGQFGSICGEPNLQIPAPKRFYAGSATTLRGYKYLSVSPLEGRKPIGGRSLLIGSIEPRVRLYDKLYLAAFYDFGNVYEKPFPDFKKKILSSIGTGIRYLTPVGSFRLDIGFPLNKRKGIDKSFQIYASLAQNF